IGDFSGRIRGNIIFSYICSPLKGTMASTSHSPGGSNIIGEFSVKIPKKSNKKYSVMQFNRHTKVDFKQWSQIKMERENNFKEFKATVGEEMPVYGAGSEFGRERREEARKKKYGVRVHKYKEEDQPWILKLGGKQGKKFKGRKEGLVAENSCYYILKQLPDSSFEAHPVDSFYNFAPMIQYRTLNAEEAEEEFGRRDRTMNFFTVMLQKKLKDTTEEADQEGKQKKDSKSKGLTITEDDEFQNLLLSDDEGSDDNGDSSSKKKSKKQDGKGGKDKKTKKKTVDDEAEEESDEGDFDARELDYISEESSEGEAEIEEKHDIKGIDQELQKMEEDEQENEENEAQEEGEGEASKEEGEIDNNKQGDDSDSSHSDSSDSDIDDTKIQSALLMQKRPGKKSSNKSSSRSSTSSRSNTPTPNDTTMTLSDAAVKLQKEPDASGKVKKAENLSSRSTEKGESKKIKTENGDNKFQAIKRPASSSSGEHLKAKKMRTESPVPRTGTPPSEQGITEDIV
ncbi:hypothetical protein BSL78_03351, partial [Apostichopus japonicus]